MADERPSQVVASTPWRSENGSRLRLRALYLGEAGRQPHWAFLTRNSTMDDVDRHHRCLSAAALVDADTGWGACTRANRKLRRRRRAAYRGSGSAKRQVIARALRSSREEMTDRVKAAVDARTDSGFVIMARTDALAVEGIERAIERALACVEAGADMIFPEAITELGMYRRFKEDVKVPILANITEFGHTPLYTREELGSVGVDLVLHCCSAYRAMNLAALHTYQAIRRDGTQKNVLDTMQTRAICRDLTTTHTKKFLSIRGRKGSDSQFRGASGVHSPKKPWLRVTAGNTALCTVVEPAMICTIALRYSDIANPMRVRGNAYLGGTRSCRCAQ